MERSVSCILKIRKFTDMLNFLYVALGGALGASLRYGLSSWLNAKVVGDLPYGTLAVNLLGSLAIGWIWGMFLIQSSLPPRLQLFLMTGFLGGFTTFSAFSLEGWLLLQQGHYKTFAIYFLLSNAGGLFFAFAGLRITGNTLNMA